jgi:hypothetical protein
MYLDSDLVFLKNPSELLGKSKWSPNTWSYNNYAANSTTEFPMENFDMANVNWYNLTLSSDNNVKQVD